jgi:drug/metabolite transporter, DME family
VPPSFSGPLLILTTALLFSTGGAAIKLTQFSAWQVACLRSAVAFVCLAALRPRWRECLRPRVLLVATAYAAQLVLFVASNKLTTAANTIFLQSTSLLWVLLLGPLLLKERLRVRDAGFGAAVLLGMTLVFFGADAPARTAPDPRTGNLLALLGGLAWGLSLLGLRWLAGVSGLRGRALAETALISACGLSALACLPLALPFEAHAPEDWLVVGYLGAFQMALAFLCMLRGVQRLPAIEVALLLLLEPVLSVLWAWLLHGERPAPGSLAGCSLIFAATLGRAIAGTHGLRAHVGGDAAR